MVTNPLSALSYTNKDFNSIYVELLDLAKELTQKWDPTISNESDPGVILLKLDALIADKNNYNIDKNILEAFPQTVTQEVNARNSYKQLGYKMPWYQSATTTLTMHWVGNELADGVKVTVPRYTMVTNDDGSIIYTIVDEVYFTNTETVVTAKAMEGTIVTHSINNDTTIDISNIDMSNRLFLNDYSVAENGVFITNVDSLATNTWAQVDNLQVTPLRNKFYEFGVDSRNSTCYIEFPEDIDSLIGSGISVKYLVSSGEQGNIPAKTLEKFYEEITVDVAGNSVALTEDIVEFYNSSAALDGANPQELDDAYRSYIKTVGTFNTLVTLRDYINAIYNSGLISNGYVCDRNDDVQSTYNVIIDDNVDPIYTYVNNTTIIDNTTDINSIKASLPSGTNKDILTALEALKNVKTEPELNAFDLRLYALSTPSTISNVSQFESTFDIIPSESTKAKEILGYIQEQQCISHDFKDIIPDVPCMFQNSYPLNIKIIPQTYLTTNQIQEVKVNVIKSFYNILNSHAIDFGSEPDYDIIYDAIYNADERIKTAILDDFSYITFAVYWDPNIKDFKRIPINHVDELGVDQVIIIKSSSELKKWSSLKSSSNFTRNDMTKARRDAGYFIYVPSSTEDKIYMNLQTKEIVTEKSSTSIELKKYDIFRYNTVKQKFTFYSDKFTEFQRNILLKSILAGKTPLLLSNSSFEYGIHHEFKDEVELTNLTTGLTIAPFCKTSGDGTLGTIISSKQEIGSYGEVDVPMPNLITSTSNNALVASYTMQPNETLRFLAPSFQTTKSYSNYVKFELVLKDGISTLQQIGDRAQLSLDETYYITKEARARALYDCLYTLSKYFTYLNYNLKDYFVSSTVIEDSAINDAIDKLYKAITDLENKDSKTSDDQAQLSTLETLYEDITRKKEVYDLWKNALSNYTDSSIKFVKGHIPLGFEDDKETSTSCVISCTTASEEIHIVDLQKIDSTPIQLETLLEDLEKANITLAWRSTSSDLKDLYVNDAYCTRQGLTSKRDDDTLELIIDDYDLVVHSAFTLNTIAIYSAKKIFNIAADTDYKLQKGESITFFWRKEDGDDTPYTYEHYEGIDDETSTKKSPIIKANFQLEGIETSKFLNLAESGEIKAGTPQFELVNVMVGSQDLSGTKAIEMREMNQVNLNRVNGIPKQQNKYYFITKSIDSEVGEYQMPFKLMNSEAFCKECKGSFTEVTKDGKVVGYEAKGDSDLRDKYVMSYRYTLQNDEYFIYTSNDMTEYEVLGAGTLIGINAPFNSSYIESKDIDRTEYTPLIYTVSAPCIDYAKLVEGGLEAFQDECIDIPVLKDYEMFCREQQVYTIVAGNKLYITMDSESGRDFITANQHLVSLTEGLNRPYFCSWLDTYVKGFQVSYSDSTGEHSLPKLSIANDVDCVWTGRSYLNLNSAANDSQEIIAQYDNFVSSDKKSSQFIIYNTDGGNAVFPELPEDTHTIKLEDKMSIMLESSIPLDKVGGDLVDISYIDGTGESHATSIYLYELNEKLDTAPYHIRDDGVVEVTFSGLDGTNSDQYIELSLDKDFVYLLKVENTSDTSNFTLLEVTSGGDVELTRLGDLSSDCGYGVSYFKLPSIDDDSLTLKIMTDVSSQDTLLLYPLVKGQLNSKLFKEDVYSDEPKYQYLFEEDDSGIENDFFKSLQKLDYESHFKYNHIVEDENLIEDPLAGESFFNSKHIYNQFTIAKAEIQLSSATGSSITVVNNR